jgi:hypothetical protein
MLCSYLDPDADSEVPRIINGGESEWLEIKTAIELLQADQQILFETGCIDLPEMWTSRT